MDTKDKLIINKLLKVALKQQKILMKLAQAVPADDSQANIQYLKGAWQTAALNSGVTEVLSPTVQHTPGSTNPDGVVIGDNYMVTGEMPINKRELMLRQFKNQIASQKPELDGKVSTIFSDPSTKQPV